MNNTKLRTYDGVAIACSLMLPSLFYTEISKIIEENSSAAWLSLLISFVLMICIFLIISSLMQNYEGKNIIEITEIVFGKPVAVIYAIILGTYLCYFSGIYIREGAETLKTYGLINTPIYVIVGLIILTAIVMNIFGDKAIIKSTGFFFVIMLLSIVFVLILGVNRYNTDYLFPILGNGIQNAAGTSLYHTSMFDGIILLTLLAPSFKNTRSLRKTGILSLIVAASSIILLCLCCVMIFSPQISSILTSSFMEIGKSSYFNHFFYRFESVLLLFLISFTLIFASLGLLTARKSFSEILNTKPSNNILLCGSAIVIFALIPLSMIDLRSHFILLRQISLWFIAGFQLLLFIISRIKKVKHEKI